MRNPTKDEMRTILGKLSDDAIHTTGDLFPGLQGDSLIGPSELIMRLSQLGYLSHGIVQKAGFNGVPRGIVRITITPEGHDWLQTQSKEMTGEVNWGAPYNRLFEFIDRAGPTYYSGGRFIRVVQQLDPYFPSYNDYISERRTAGKSTSRRDFYRDIFLSLDPTHRANFVGRILDEIGSYDVELASEIRKLMGGGSAVPLAAIPDVYAASNTGRGIPAGVTRTRRYL